MKIASLEPYGFPGYSVTDSGRVWCEKSGKWLEPTKSLKGFYRVFVCNKMVSVHRLVAMAFVPNPDNKPEVKFLDGNKFNVNAYNLKWANKYENLYNPLTSDKVGVLTEADVHIICRQLEEGIGCKKIASIHGYPYAAVYQIKRGENWKHISSQYNFVGPIKQKKRLTSEEVEDICQDIISKEMSIPDILKKYQITRDAFDKIKSGKNWKNITEKYFSNK